MKGQIKKIEVDGKEYELKKQGVNISLTIQSIFIELVFRAGIESNPENLTDSQIEIALMAGMRGNVLNDIKEVIKEVVFTPKITDGNYDDLSPETVPALFWQLYLFHVGTPEKKSEGPNKSSSDTETGDKK